MGTSNLCSRPFSSWPVLKAMVNVEDIAQLMNKTTAFRQLNDNKDLFENADYLKEWPIQEGDSKEQLRI